jgi:hypothetical protein
MSLSKKIALGLAFVVPCLFLGVVYALVYWPYKNDNLQTRPQINYIYTLDEYVYQNFQVVDGQLKKTVRPSDDANLGPKEEVTARIYYHNVQSNLSLEISFEEAKKYKLDPSKESPDGYTFSEVYDSSIVWFTQRPDRVQYILTSKGKNYIQNVVQDPGKRLSFIGWVVVDDK